MILTIIERIEWGIQKFGRDSEFKKTVDDILNQKLSNNRKLNDCFEKYKIPVAVVNNK